VKNILLINAIGYPVQAKIDKKSKYEKSFVGELHLSCINLNPKQKKLLGLLLRRAMYPGVGHKKGNGYDHIKIDRLDKRMENKNILYGGEGVERVSNQSTIDQKMRQQSKLPKE